MRSANGVVASAHYLATDAGARILRAGGNAVDAAVATGFALGVCEPAGSGIGGMAMMLIHPAGSDRTIALAGPCLAPANATPEAVAASHRYRGIRAVAVPTHVATLARAVEAYGTRSPSEVLAPAIELADEGFPVTDLLASLSARYGRALAEESGGRLYASPGGAPLAAGSTLRNPELARTMRRLAEAGFDDFYRGGIARRIAREMEEAGGFVTAHDLAAVGAPQETEPLEATIGGREVRSLGTPAGGVTLLEILALADRLDLLGSDPEDPEGVLRIAAVIREARLDRQQFYRRIRRHPHLPFECVLTEEHLERTAERIRRRPPWTTSDDRDGAADVADIPRRFEGAGNADRGGSGETTHVVAADRFGNVVSLTQSIERSFGSKVVAAGGGFLYNGYLRAFKVESRAHPHFLRPGAPARSNAAPTIVVAGGRAVQAIGSSGSERMASTIALTLTRLWRGADPYAAVAAPRMHVTPEGEVLLEAERFSPGVHDALAAAGYRSKRLEAWDFATGGLQLAARDGATWSAVGEPRRDGAAAGGDTSSGA